MYIFKAKIVKNAVINVIFDELYFFYHYSMTFNYEIRMEDKKFDNDMYKETQNTYRSLHKLGLEN